MNLSPLTINNKTIKHPIQVSTVESSIFPNSLQQNLLKINTIALDIDGTILTSNNIIQPGLEEICLKLKNNNINLVLASARPISSVINIAEKLSISSPAVGLNGSIIANKDQIFYKASFCTKEIRDVLSKFDNISVNYYIDYEWVVDERDDNIILEEKLVSMTASIKDIDIPEIQKILIIGERHQLINIKTRLAFNENVECNFSKHNYLEINPSGINKVLGIKKCLNTMGLTSQVVMAIGDGENDIPMIREFNLGISMGNAPQEVKNVAQHVLDTNDNSGLVKFLNDFCKLRGFN